MDYNSSVGSTRETSVVAEFSTGFEQDEFVPYTEMLIFDELSEKLWNDHLFINAHLNWGVAPGILYKQADRVGYDRARDEIREVMKRSGIRSKGKYLRARLLNLKVG